MLTRAVLFENEPILITLDPFVPDIVSVTFMATFVEKGLAIVDGHNGSGLAFKCEAGVSGMKFAKVKQGPFARMDDKGFADLPFVRVTINDQWGTVPFLKCHCWQCPRKQEPRRVARKLTPFKHMAYHVWVAPIILGRQ